MAARSIVVAFALFLLGLTVVVFAKPTAAERFFKAFASSARAHYTEQVSRLLIGASLIVLSPTMWQSGMFRFVGWAIVLPSLVLMLLPWRWHQRFGERVLPILIRRMKLYAVGLLAFGILLLYGVFASVPDWCGESSEPLPTARLAAGTCALDDPSRNPLEFAW